MNEHVVEVVLKSGLWRVVEGAFIMSSHAERSDALDAGALRAGDGGRLLLRGADGVVSDVTHNATADRPAPSAT